MENPYQNTAEPEQKSFEFDTANFFESFIGVGKELVLRPRLFFKGLPRTSDIKNPFIYLVICSFLSSLLMANIQKGDINFFMVLMVANTLSAFVGGFVLHLLVTRIYGISALFGSSFRIIAYASLMDIVSWTPIFGFVAYFYGLYLIFIGLQETLHLKPRQAGTAVMLIILIITVLLFFAIFMAAGNLPEGMKMLEQGGSGTPPA